MEERKNIEQKLDTDINLGIDYCQNHCHLYQFCQHNPDHCPMIGFENTLKSLTSTHQFVIRNIYGINNAKIKIV